VRVGKIDVKVGGEGGVRKEARVLGESPVLKLGDGRKKEQRRKEVVVLNIDEEGKVTRPVEVDDVCEPTVRKSVFVVRGNLEDQGMLEYKSI